MPDDLLHMITPKRKETSGTDFDIAYNLRVLDEDLYDRTKVSNRGLPNNQSSHASNNHTNNNNNNNNFFFNADMADIKNMEKETRNNYGDTNALSPSYYINSPPPGLTPTRYIQKSTVNNFPAPMLGGGSSSQNNLMGASPNNSSYSFNGLNIPGLSLDERSPSPGTDLYGKKTGALGGLRLNASGMGDDIMNLQGPMSNPNMFGHPNIGPQYSFLRQFGSSDKKKPIILEESKQRYTGKLKFFDENKNYGFIIMDEDGSDIFVHFDDLYKAGIGKELLKTARHGNMIKLSFSCMNYIGKYDRSRKAVEVQLLGTL
jgi:hypothetical protein